MYDIFGKYGAIRQIRIGNTPETKGTALVIYEDIFEAKNACDHLSGFNVCNRYLVVLYYQRNRVSDIGRFVSVEWQHVMFSVSRAPGEFSFIAYFGHMIAGKYVLCF